MPLSMKIQPIDAGTGEKALPEMYFPATKPVVKSRLKRLFRISTAFATAEKEEAATAASDGGGAGEVFEPSSVCLAKMVQNFLEESNEKQQQQQSSPATRCGRNRCNCFNGNGSDGSDGEPDAVSASDVSDFLKSLVVCGSVNERNVLADTARIVADKNNNNKAGGSSKRKDEARKNVAECLVSLGYDAAICKSKWDKSPSFPAGEYEYVDVIIGGERLIIDIDFRSQFEVARSTKTYKSILQILPHIFVGKSDRLSKIICILSEAAKQSLKKKGMHIPPWRKADYVQAKWLSPPTRLVSPGPTATPPPSPITPVGPVMESNGPSSDESEPSVQNSPQFESVFDMSESSSGEEDVKKEKQKDHKFLEIIPKGSRAGVKMVTGLASIMEEKP